MTVYVIHAPNTGLFKIGVTKSVKARLLDLQVGSPSVLGVLLTIDGGAVTERDLHTEYSHWRRHGEWFALMPEHLTELFLRGQPWGDGPGGFVDVARLRPMFANERIAAFLGQVACVTVAHPCANRLWYGRDENDGFQHGFKHALRGLVGWFGETSFRDDRDYRSLYSFAYDLLPNCHGCGCAR